MVYGNFGVVVEPVAEGGKCKMLAEDTGLLVWTVKEAERADRYYAVTTVAGGAEDKTLGKGNTAGPVKEVKQPIGAVRYYIEMGKVGRNAKEIVPVRDWYIMWMDYESWNTGYVGYAFPFAITRRSFKEGGPAPMAHLDGIGTMNVFTAGYTNYACGDFSRNALPTWYFGYGQNATLGRDLRKINYKFKDTIVNFVQYRILQTVLWARRKYKITDPRFIIQGNSMGASGAIGFALQYPKFVTAIWSNEGLTKYDYVLKTEGGRINMWQSSTWGNYGHPELKNPAKFLPFGDPRLDWVLKHNGTNIYDIRDAAKFLEMNVAEDFPLLVIGHCFQDGSIPYYSQAAPFEKYIRNSRHCFSYTLAKGGHGWGSAWSNGNMIKLVNWYESRPGFSNVPPIVGWRYNKKGPTTRTYMYKVAWGVKAKPIKGKAIEETADSWTLPIIHAAKEGQEEDYAVDVTPRNLQKLKVKAGEKFSYQIKTLDGSKVEMSGDIVADKHNLLLVPKVPIRRSGALVVVNRK
ncbi:hypothetical protein LCGC14_2063660 [marine sediment metagenome]|uniref:Peptidase S9 prolyl oligopeptidase catalytic domain-containing protein n=1 Tax=marine sediment metagenome TaxID=412755 RepID=A0A0F9HHE0_9ZZZZ